jgi:membrane associated rhomboid family serine protease
MAYSETSYRPGISPGDKNNSVLSLIIISLVVFAGLGFMWGVWLFTYPKETAEAIYNQNILSWFVFPANTNELLHKPWVIITHIFADNKFLSVFPNMFWLWCFGYILQDVGGNKKVIPLFIYGSLAGAIVFLLAYNLIPSLKVAMPVATLAGAAPGVMAVAAGTVIASPQYRIFPLLKGGIPVWVLLVIYVAADVLSIGINNTAVLAAHIAGALAGIGFILLLKNGINMGNWITNFIDWVNNLFNPDKPRKGSNIKEELFYKTTRPPFIKTANPTESRVDALLDKVNNTGYSSLTDEEKELLQKAAEKSE